MLLMGYVLMTSAKYPNDPPNGNTGAPGEGTCGNCHTGGSYTGTTTITGVPTSITPSTQYTVTVKNTASASVAGFSLLVLDGNNNNCGTLLSSSTDVAIQGSSKRYAEQTAKKSYTAGAVQWTFKWTSPATLANNNITFYTSVVMANNNNSTSGDKSSEATFTGTLMQSVSPVAASIASSTNVSCNGGSNGSATASATGGTPPYTYAWSNGQSSATASNLSAGSYTVTVTGGTTSTANITITEPNPLNVSTTASNTTITCGSPTASVSVSASGGTGASNFAWSNGQTGPTLTTSIPNTYTVTATDTKGCTSTKTYIITSSNTPPTVSITAQNSTLNCINSSTQLSASGANTYVWNNGLGSGSSVFASPSVTTTYSVTATDAGGCTAVQTKTIMVDKTLPIVTATANNPTLNCTTSSTSLIANGGISYTWSNGLGSNATTTSVTPTTSTIYTVTATASNGCTDTKSVTVSVDKTAPIATISTNTSTITCINTAATLTATGGGSYNWGNGLGTTSSIFVTPTVATTYTVTATGSNGCTAIATQAIAINTTKPNITLTPKTAILTCTSASVALKASSTTTNSSFSWSGPNGFNANKDTIKATTIGKYIATVFDTSNGCSVQDTATITQDANVPVLTVTNGVLSCKTKTVNVTATSNATGTFAWSGPNGFTAAAQNITATLPGLYVLTQTASNGCKKSATSTITSNTTAPFAQAGPDAKICPSQTIKLTGKTFCSICAPTFQWTSPNGTFVSVTTNIAAVDVKAAGTYILAITDTLNGCVSRDTAVVTNGIVPVPTVKTSVLDCKSCAEASVGANTAATYVWSNGSTIAKICNLAPNTYNVTATSIDGCSATASAVVSAPSPVVIVANKTINANPGKSNGSATVNITGGLAAYTYSWADATGKVVSTSADLTNAAAGTYILTVKDANGCVGTYTVIIKSVVGTEDVEANIYIQVSPNPNDGHFDLQLKQTTEATLRVLNIEGQVVHNQTLVSSNSLDLSALPQGMYFLHLNVGAKMIVKRVMIQK